MSELTAADLARVFVIEGEEILDQMEEAFMKLEKEPGNAAEVQAIFRGAHTLKGNASCMGLTTLTSAAHEFENTLEELLEGAVCPDSNFITIALSLIDRFRELIPAAAINGDANDAGMDELLAALTAWRNQSTAAADPDDSTAKSAPKENPSSSRRAIRIEVERLDQMMNLVGELAIARGQIRGMVEHDGAPAALAEAFAEVDALGQQLQELVTRVRMIPIETIFRPFGRVVRDLAAQRDKCAQLVIEGGDVEVDLSVIEHLKDPLVHMIRNAVDHGIELPGSRIRSGKSAEGCLVLSAWHEGASIAIRLADDGRGLQREPILARARRLGIAGDLERLNDEEVYRLVLEPGFSTAEEVSEISGRGIGLDVVRRNVEAIRGSIDIANHGGAVFTLRVPLTLAIIDGFAVGVGEETYILPLDAVTECLELDGNRHGSRSEGLLHLRGEPVPFIDLGNRLGVPSHKSRRHVAILRGPMGRVGIAVDRLEGQRQTVIKPLGKIFDGLREFSGSSILSDGRVALVLDVPGLMQRVQRERVN